MKKLIIASMLVTGIMATAQLSQSNHLYLRDNLISNVNDNLQNKNCEIIEEEDEPFDFDTKDYLPFGFNPYAICQYEDIIEISIEEKDATFDFNTKMYLPINFNPYAV